VPTGDSSWKGELIVRHPDKTRSTHAIKSRIKAGTETWSDTYTVLADDGTALESVVITHKPGEPNVYHYRKGGEEAKTLSCSEAELRLAGSEFLLTDLGLEFLSWTNQARIKGELRRGQSCHVLESRPPENSSSTYSKVVTWIDKDSGGILEAEAYGVDARVLKEFSVGSFRKVDGVWHLEEMEMRNRKTGARTWIEFEIESDKD
jgi:hypothetical protein